MSTLINQIGTVLSACIGWLGTTVGAFFGTASSTSTTEGVLADLLPFLALSMGIGLVGLGVKYVRSFIKIG